jgi:surface antigen
MPFMPAAALTAALAVACLSLSACSDLSGVGGTGTRQVVGGLGGAAAGGLLGSQFGHGTGKLAMTGLGVLAGALAGSAAGGALDRADQAALQQNTQAALNTPKLNRPIVWNNPQNGHRVSVTPTREGWSGTEYCREYQQTIVVGGHEQQSFGQACRQPDGAWRVAP